MSTHIKGWSQGDVIGTLRHLGCDLVVDGLHLRIGRALFWRSDDGTWSVAAGAIHRHTHTLEEMIDAQQAITTAGALLCDQWSGWIVGEATAGGEVGDAGAVKPFTAVCPFKVGDTVAYTGSQSWLVGTSGVVVHVHAAACGDGWWVRYMGLPGSDHNSHSTHLRKVKTAHQASVTTENGTFNVGEAVMVRWRGCRVQATVCEVDRTDTVMPIRAYLPDVGLRWVNAMSVTHA